MGRVSWIVFVGFMNTFIDIRLLISFVKIKICQLVFVCFLEWKWFVVNPYFSIVHFCFLHYTLSDNLNQTVSQLCLQSVYNVPTGRISLWMSMFSFFILESASLLNSQTSWHCYFLLQLFTYMNYHWYFTFECIENVKRSILYSVCTLL